MAKRTTTHVMVDEGGGHSGAAIIQLTDVETTEAVLKVSIDPQVNKRLIDQALMLREVRMLSNPEGNQQPVPEVYGIFSTGYEMEYLETAPIQHQKQLLSAYDDILTALLRIWSVVPVPRRLYPWMVPAEDFDARAHSQYIQQRIDDWFPMSLWTDRMRKQFKKLRRSFFRSMREHRFPTIPTHGDPTLSNLMYRSRNKKYDIPVLIDALPASTVVPSIGPVDTGKVLQSVFGYERIVNRIMIEPDMNFVLNLVLGFGSSVRTAGDYGMYGKASFYWCVCHFLRLLPYHHYQLHPMFQNAIKKALEISEDF